VIHSDRYAENNEKFDIDEVTASIPEELNSCQRRAYLAAARHKAVLIAGGAGVGKSYVVGRIARLYADAGYRVALAAPTGKAAKRIEQIVDMPAQTVHRLLKYNGHEFARNEESPLNCDVVIVDEVSMLDVPLCYRLFKAIDFTKTNLVLVGDHNQLPPVGPGNIIRDILTNELIPTVILDEVVRQAGLLKLNSIAILNGRVAGNTENDEGRKSWYLVDKFSEQNDILNFIMLMYEKILDEKLGYHLVNNVQLLAPMKKGLLGVDSLNVVLQRLIQKKYYGVDVEDVPSGRRPRFYLHDKVIQLRNNYDLNVMNGSIGVIESYDADSGVYTIIFDEGETLVDRDGMKDVALAYALTFHKSQGSEYDCGIVIVHKSQSFMHHRNLFYTGVTRAKMTAIIIGDRWGIRNCAKQKITDRRRTFLSLDGFPREVAAG
jgi:exodeoxyribonuclease V alpha subunit